MYNQQFTFASMMWNKQHICATLVTLPFKGSEGQQSVWRLADARTRTIRTRELPQVQHDATCILRGKGYPLFARVLEYVQAEIGWVCTAEVGLLRFRVRQASQPSEQFVRS